MKRTIFVLALCLCLLVLLSTLFVRHSKAKTDVLQSLLEMPAPPPPNPLMSGARVRDKSFYDKARPPADDAPIEELIDYWSNRSYSRLGRLSNNPSDRTVDRLLNEASRDPGLLSKFIGALPDNKAVGDSVKDIYERLRSDPNSDKGERTLIKDWLKMNSPYFSGDLERTAGKTQDNNGYVDLQSEKNLLALTRHNYDLASPIVTRMYADKTQPVTQVLATWALYRRALDTDSTSDIERYRTELMKMVENRDLPDGVRDKANDALAFEKDFPGREEWTLSLFEDETLVNMPRFTMLTTLSMYSPTEKYVPKLLDLLVKTSNPTARSGAAQSLMLFLNQDSDPALKREIVAGLLPWLEDPKWATDKGDSRGELVRHLNEIEMRESVPGLIKMLDERSERPDSMTRAGIAANAAAAAANSGANSARITTNSNMAVANTAVKTEMYYPFRDSAISALATQKDARAVPPLRRILAGGGESYWVNNVVRAIYSCNGFTTAEQVEALESAAIKLRKQTDTPTDPSAAGGGYSGGAESPKGPPTAKDIRSALGLALTNATEISDELARAIVERIEQLDKQNKPLAESFRSLLLRWQNTAINFLMLRDVKRGVAEADVIVKLLAERKTLREKQSTDIFDIRTGVPLAVGVATCLLEDRSDAANILDNGDTVTRTSLLACARLTRLSLPVDKVAKLLASDAKQLALAAELYLESEDSPDARAAVLARHPNEARILGATSAFFPEGTANVTSQTLYQLFQSVGENSLYNGWYGSDNDEDLEAIEKRLRNEIKKSDDLIAVYSYDRNYVRIYKDKVMFSWDEDDSRYRERRLEKHEFDELKAYIANNKLDELPPFLACGGEYCTAKELVMLGKAGGRRLYVNGETHPVFAGLEKYFAGLKQAPSSLKYSLSGEIAGLEIVIASDDLHAETVWKEGNELKIAASRTAVRKKIEDDIEKLDDEDDSNYEEVEKQKQSIRDKHEYDGYSWYRITENGAEPGAAQPVGVEFIPLIDGASVPATDDQWKSRAAGFEIRATIEGLFKIVRGRAVKIRSGGYSSPVISANGRWVMAKKDGDEYGSVLVRIDLTTNREYAIEIEKDYGSSYPSAFVPTLNKFLIARSNGYDNYQGEVDDTTPSDADPATMKLVDPATGTVQPIAGEFRPLDQQTFRPLQATGKPNEFWAAMPDDEKNQTQVGIYDTRTFGFRAMLKVPNIKFNSMDMFADEAAGKLYFVYRGHLLSLPLKR